MQSRNVYLAAAILVFAGTGNAQQPGGLQASPRRVAVTFDDLPAISATRPEYATHHSIVAALILKLTAGGAPAMGFVNENILRMHGDVDARRVALLEQWLDAGFELGNHSYSHLDFNATERERFEQDVVRGEEITSWLLSKRQEQLTYFRFPFLHTGADVDERKHFEQFLALRGYVSVPVTVDASDWSFSAAYDQALDRGDSAMMRRIGKAYLQHTEQEFAFCERLAAGLFGREPSQILLLHANALNAEYLGDILHAAQRRGYRFISVEDALRDSLYQQPDTYQGTGGISWLLRWAEARDIDITTYGRPPHIPDFVVSEAVPK